MVASIKILRSGTAGNRPSGRQYGEPYVNIADNQLGVMDSSNVARDLLGVPMFSPSTSYVAGNPVNYQGNLYIANTSISAGAWNSTQWTLVKGYLSPTVTALITVGYTFAPFNGGTKSSGTFTPDPTVGSYQYYTNNGAHTVAAPTADCAIDILITNGASAGAITFTGFTVGAVTGDALTLTSGNIFILSIRRINAISTYSIKALQ